MLVSLAAEGLGKGHSQISNGYVVAELTGFQPIYRALGSKGSADSARLLISTSSKFAEASLYPNELVDSLGGGPHNYDVKGSLCLVLNFALPLFSLPLPSVVQFLEQNRL